MGVDYDTVIMIEHRASSGLIWYRELVVGGRICLGLSHTGQTATSDALWWVQTGHSHGTPGARAEEDGASRGVDGAREDNMIEEDREALPWAAA